MSLEPGSEKHLLEFLRQSGDLSELGWRLIQDFMQKWQLDAYEAILATNLITEQRLAEVLARQLKMDRLYSIRQLGVQQSDIKRLSFETAKRLQALVIGPDRNNGLEIVVANPLKPGLKGELAREVGEEITLSVGERNDIVDAIDNLYPFEDQVPQIRPE